MSFKAIYVRFTFYSDRTICDLFKTSCSDTGSEQSDRLLLQSSVAENIIFSVDGFWAAVHFFSPSLSSQKTPPVKQTDCFINTGKITVTVIDWWWWIWVGTTDRTQRQLLKDLKWLNLVISQSTKTHLIGQHWTRYWCMFEFGRYVSQHQETPRGSFEKCRLIHKHIDPSACSLNADFWPTCCHRYV